MKSSLGNLRQTFPSGLREWLVIFWPLLVTPVVMVAAVRFGYPWIGFFLFAGLAFMRRWWWSCIFGLMNAGAIYGGLIACLLAAWRMRHG